ncbi:hypothetical protein C1645_759531 [Glomus cerebriforme]|uniref:Homeodomain-like protein n=1 Tax=Glomus cerebriforme TaxID=658196 RepID=A0A397TCF1_9GLOM|nr:hypothetical protein C1645_759531 [Glomus cerebriforme]
MTEDQSKLLQHSVSKHGNRTPRVSKKQKSSWTKEEDKLLIDLVKKHGTNWKKISSLLGRHDNNVLKRYYKITREEHEKDSGSQVHDVTLPKYDDGNNAIKKASKWTKEDQNKLLKLVDTHGKDWIKIGEIMNRSKSSICKQYIIITEDKKDNDDQQNSIKTQNLDKNTLRTWTYLVRYKVNSNLLQQCQRSWRSCAPIEKIK